MSITPPVRIEKKQKHHPIHSLSRIDMRKIKSVLAILVGFFFWQILRLFLPDLEVHPIFIYIYGMIEVRETSEKTRNYGRMRVIATFIAIGIGVPVMLLTDRIKPILKESWMDTGVEICILIFGALLVRCTAERANCHAYSELAAAIYLILMVGHFQSSMYLYSIMRIFQTIVGVTIAWLINVKILPHPPKPGTLRYLLMKWDANKIEKISNSQRNKNAVHTGIQNLNSSIDCE